jgi:hypothetical protein
MPTPTAAAPRRFPLILVGLLTAAAFGPYLTGSIRTEQLAVYGAAAFLLPFTMASTRPYFPVVLPWFALIVVALLGLIPPTAHSLVHPPAGMLSSVDNLVLPLAVMLLLWSVVPVSAAGAALRVAAALITWGAAINGILGIIGTRTDISAYLRFFWGGGEGETTAERAADLGRLSGIFNQPAEAGVVYGLAGILAVWRFRHKPNTMWLLLTLICVGGMLCVSKVFIFGGLPLVLLYLWKSRQGGGKLGVLFSAVIVAVGVAQSGLLQQWTGFNYLARLFAPREDQELIEFYSAGRWNPEAGMVDVFDTVLKTRPLTGFGVEGLKVSYDSAWTEAMVLSGVAGLVFLALVLFALWRMALRIRDSDVRTLGLFIAMFLAAASLGIPSLTVNRAATLVWVVLGLLCLMARQGAAASSSDAADRMLVPADDDQGRPRTAARSGYKGSGQLVSSAYQRART